MPSLQQMTNLDLSGYSPTEPTQHVTGSLPSSNLEPGHNRFLRCPIPPVWTTTPDTLRQFYKNDVVPQFRLFNPS